MQINCFALVKGKYRAYEILGLAGVSRTEKGTFTEDALN
jgi:hypothetical protein